MGTVSGAAFTRTPAIEVPALVPDRGLRWPICWTGVEFIARGWEKCRLRAYKPLPTDPWTCGWGETQGVGANTVWTQAYADQRFCDSLTLYAAKVREVLQVEPNEHEFAAMVSLAYNIGPGWNPKRPKPPGAKDGFRQSTVLRRHNAGDHEGAARAFGLWNKSAGKVVRGLTNRRAAEAALYLSPPPGAEHDPMPQAVESESKLRSSPIAQAGTATAGAGGLAAVLGPVSEHVESAKAFAASAKGFVVDTLGIPSDWLLPILLIGAGVLVVHFRSKQRREGWA
jgi:lysozyme